MDGPRLVDRMSRLTDELIVVAVPVNVGRSFWVYWVSAPAILLTAPNLWRGALVTAAAVVVLLLARLGVAARQRWPVGRGTRAVLATSSSTVLLASVNMWTGRPNRIRASWPRTEVKIELGRRRLNMRKVTLRQVSGRAIVLESIANRGWNDSALIELARIADTGVLRSFLPAPAGWYADPATTTDLRYWDGASWTQRTLDPWSGRA